MLAGLKRIEEDAHRALAEVRQLGPGPGCVAAEATISEIERLAHELKERMEAGKMDPREDLEGGRGGAGARAT